MFEIAEVEELRGRTVVGSDGNKIGKVDEIYLDEQSGRPEWALVNTGLFGLKSSFVLITGARADGDQLTVPFDKATVKDAPNIDPEGALSPEEEHVLFAHYGRDDHGGVAAESSPATDGGAEQTPTAGPSASLAAARLAREDESGLGGTGEAPGALEGERTQADLDALRRGPEGETGRSENEDPVPPDGGPPPRQDHALPEAAAETADAEAAGAGVVGDAPATDEATGSGEHWEDHALPERGNQRATPDHGPASEPTERDVLEAPETPDVPSPGGSGVGGRSRLRKYVAPGSADAARPGAPDPEPHEG